MTQRYYTGVRHVDGNQVHVRFDVDNVASPLPLCTEIANHSPTGFEWGYSGSGPAQLALAILHDHLKWFPADIALARKALPSTDESDANALLLRLHHKFKAACVTRLEHESWQLTSDDVRTTLQSLVEKRQAEATMS